MTSGLSNMNQHNLLHWIDMISFCMVDMELYLDTHPDDKEAIKYFEQYKALRNEAVTVYSNKFTPLLLDCADNDQKWKWATSAWPWEKGGCC